MRRFGSSGPKVVDLFAGAGLLSFAFAAEGFRIVRAIEQEYAAARTYQANIGDHIEVADVRAVRPYGNCEVLIAGPPCQGFSTLGKREQDDPRNALSLEIIAWAKILRPRIIVIENVATFLGASVWQRLAEGLTSEGYLISSKILNAHDFGVPQLRSRSFTFASLINIPEIRPLPGPLIRTVREAWVGLPPAPDGRNNHYAPKPSSLAFARMVLIPPGGDKRDVMSRKPSLTPPSWWTLNCQVTDVWGRMDWDNPSNTLRTCLLNPSKGRYIHPDQHRVISLREAARLHSIPDNWHFYGKPCQVARQIGNSVPPLLGRAVARSVLEALN